MKATQRALAQGEPSEAELARLQALIQDEHAQPLLETGMNGERAFLVELLRRVEGGKVRLSTLIRSPLERWIAAVGGDFGSQQALALEWMNEAVAITRRPILEQRSLSAAWDAKISAFYASQLKRLTSPLPHLLTPSMSSASNVFVRSRAELGATVILIAAERQRRKTGKWPASIQEIDPSILPEAPAEPFSGEPFHFEQRDGKLFVYSIGPNGKDEHGAYDPKRWLNGGPDDVGAKAWDVKLRRQPPVPSKAPGRSQGQRTKEATGASRP
jgi:hypothetical protein